MIENATPRQDIAVVTGRSCASRWILIVTAFLAAPGVSPLQATPITISQFSFIGDCLDCTGQGSGILTLQNYAPGNAVDITNFVSFTYTSNLMSLALNGTGPGPGQVSDFLGGLPASLPGFAGITMNSQSVLIFQSMGSGSWCSGFNGCNLDFGINGVFEQGAIPEPASFALTFTGSAGLMLLGLRVRRAR